MLQSIETALKDVDYSFNVMEIRSKAREGMNIKA
jgi:hypothetical protein